MPNKIIKYNEPEFKKLLDVLIDMYKIEFTQQSNSLINLGSLFFTAGFALLGWYIQPIQDAIKTIWAGNWLIKFIAFCVGFTVVWFSYKTIMSILKWIKIDKRLLSSATILKKLYTAKVYPKDWEITIELDNEGVINKLVEIKKGE